MTNSAASPITSAGLRAHLAAELGGVSWSRRLGLWAAVGAVFGWVYWYTRVDPRLFLGLVGIFAFHELGHLLAARVLQLKQRRGVWLKRDLAQVAPGESWREATVTLAGPLPGLVVAVGLMTASLHGARLDYGEAAYAIALFNGLTLLPFFPLDGGRFFHVLFFGRHPWTEVGFRVIAALGIASGAVLAGNPWLMLFALLPAMNLRTAFTLGLLAKVLRARHPHGEVSDDLISDALSRGFPKERRAGVLARNAVVLRSLVSSRRPPTATMFVLGATYLLGVAAAVVVIFFPNLLG